MLNEELGSQAAMYCNIHGWGQRKEDFRRNGGRLSDPALILPTFKLYSKKFSFFF